MSFSTSSAAALSANNANSNPKVKGLHYRGRQYYSKLKTPVRVLKADPTAKAQVWKSLNTTDYDTAVIRLREVTQAANDSFKAVLEKRRPGPVRVSHSGVHPYLCSQHLRESHIPAILDCFEYDLLKQDDEIRRSAGRETILARRVELEQEFSEVRAGIGLMDYSVAEKKLLDFLHRERLTVAPNSKLRDELLTRFVMRYRDVLGSLIQRLAGDGEATPSKAPVRPRCLPTLFDLYQSWSAGQTEIRTKNTYKECVDKFAAVHGSLPVMGIQQEHVMAYMDRLQESGLQRRSIENHVKCLSAIVNREILASVEPRLSSNPFAKVKFDHLPKKPTEQKRREYKMHELNGYLNSRVYTHGYRPKGQVGESARYAGLIAIFAGPRIEEIAQLRIEDIVRINGVWAIRICALNKEQKLKNEYAFRYIPIHQELIKCGLLAYAAEMKLAGHERLFPTLRRNNKYKIWSNTLTKWFGRYMMSIGLKVVATCFHSFRHNFKQQLTNCGVNPEVRDALSGHWYSERRDSKKAYVANSHRLYPFPALVSAMEQLRYDELDLSHIYVADPYANVEKAFGLRWAQPVGY